VIPHRNTRRSVWLSAKRQPIAGILNSTRNNSEPHRLRSLSLLNNDCFSNCRIPYLDFAHTPSSQAQPVSSYHIKMANDEYDVSLAAHVS